MAGLAVEPVDDPVHLDGEVDSAPDVVDARHVQPAAGQIAVVQRAHLLDAEALGRCVELADQPVDDGQRFVRGQTGRQLVEPDDVGEDDRHVLVVLGDRLLAVAVARHHGFGHQGQHQAVVLPPLLVEQVLLDREVSAHVVESDCQITEFVAGGHRKRHPVVARADLLRTCLEATDRAHEQPRQQHRRDADDEDDRHRRQHQRSRERRHRSECLRRVDLGDDGPPQPWNVGGRVGLQGFVTEIVVGDQRAALTPLRQLGGLGRHRLHQGGAVLADGVLGDVRRSSRVDDVALVGLGILEKQPGIGSHQVVGADDERLTGGAHAGVLPAAVDRHQRVDLRDRELQCQHAVDPAQRSDRRYEPCGRLVRGLVVAEVGEADVVDGVGVERLLICAGEFTALVRTVQDVGAEVDALVRAVDDVAPGVEQQGVLEFKPGDDLAEEVVELGVGGRPWRCRPWRRRTRSPRPSPPSACRSPRRERCSKLCR